MNTDPIADYLTRLRNANSAGHRVVDIPFSKLKFEAGVQEYYNRLNNENVDHMSLDHHKMKSLIS